MKTGKIAQKMPYPTFKKKKKKGYLRSWLDNLMTSSYFGDVIASRHFL